MMQLDADVHLAVNVYRWGRDPARRLLVDALGPAARALIAAGVARRFWYAGFDARGPHVFALFSARPWRGAELRTRLSAVLEAYLPAQPGGETLEPTELERRHRECLGKHLCAVDAEAGFAPNDSYRMVAQPTDGYPFRIADGLDEADELWDLCGDRALWAVDQLRGGTEAGAAVRWTAALAGTLVRAGEDPAAFFRYHASTVLLPLRSVAEAEQDEMLKALSAALGERNRAAFARVWEAVEATPPEWPPLERLTALAIRRGGGTPRARWALLREVNHALLSQLQQPERARLALWLYAWECARSTPGPATAHD